MMSNKGSKSIMYLPAGRLMGVTGIMGVMSLMVLISVLPALFFPEQSWAEESVGAVSYRLQDCIDLGLKQSHRLAAARQQTEAAQAKIGESITGYLPAVTSSAGYQHLSETDPFTLPIGPTTREIAPAITDAYALNLNIKQPVFTGFRLFNNMRKATQAWQASQEDYARSTLQLVADIKNSYWQVIRATEALKVSSESLQVVNTYLKDINSLFTQGVATSNEVLKVKSQLARTQLMVTEADQGLQLARGQLALLMGLDVQSAVDISPEPFREVRPAAAWEDVLHAALKNRAEIKVLNKQIRIAELDVAQAQAGWYPSIFLNGNFTYAQPNSRIFPPREQFDFTWELGVSAGFDIGSWSAIPFKTSQAQAKVTELRETAKQLENSITLDVMRSHLNLKKAVLQLSVADAALAQNVENRKDISARYATGLALKTEQLQAELEQLQAGLTLTESKIDYELAIVDLELATGSATDSPASQARP